MSIDTRYLDELLGAWEETYKKGQLTFWLFFAIRERPRCVSEIKAFIEEMTDGVITCEEQSLYRSLRKYYDLELVDYEPGPGNHGPDRKNYFLTDIGRELFERFTERNIRLFAGKKLRTMLSPRETST